MEFDFLNVRTSILQDLMVGEEASQLRSMLEVSYPMENGIVRNWEEMKHIWDYTFGEGRMNINPKDSKILLTEPPMNPHRNREKMVEVRLCTRIKNTTNGLCYFYLKEFIFYDDILMIPCTSVRLFVILICLFLMITVFLRSLNL